MELDIDFYKLAKLYKVLLQENNELRISRSKLKNKVIELEDQVEELKGELNENNE